MATPIPDNRARFTLGEVARAAGGLLVGGDPALELVGVSTDSRSAASGTLFVALVGAAHDGHHHVDAARARAAFPLVASGRGVEGPRVEVDDTLVALGRLARHYFERETSGRAVPVLAIGGAAGKTTTKTLAAAAVGALFGDTLVTAGNLNNRIGLPMTLFTLTPEHRAAVLEHGTSEPGEIAALAAISSPDVALVTNVGIEHSERLGDLEAIADEEGALLLAARRVAVANADDPLLLGRLARARAGALTFGRSERADLRLLDRRVGADGSTRVLIRLRGRTLVGGAGARDLTLSTRLLGESAATNLAAALAGALALFGRPASEGELARVAAALATVEAVPGRLRPLQMAGAFVLDDSYNANPRSVAAAFAAAREVAERRGARLVLALGDMLELGDLAPASHREMLLAADLLGAAELLLVGDESSRAAEDLAGALRTPHRVFADSGQAAAALAELLAPDDVLLVKGSRGLRMERLIESLEGPR